MSDDRRLIGVRLTEDELAGLNHYLKANSYDSLSDLVHSILQGRFTRKELVESFKELVSVGLLDNVNNDLQAPTIPNSDQARPVNNSLQNLENTRQIELEGASTVTSRGLTHLTNMTATCGLTSGFGMSPGRARMLWPAEQLFEGGVD